MLKKSIYILAFTEGASVLAVELLSSKMLMPFYGSSLAVWTTIIGITMFALTCGYFAGGIITHEDKDKNLIFYIFTLAALFISSMPMVGEWVMSSTLHLNIYFALIISLAFFMFPALFVLGTIPIVLIKNGVSSVSDSGKISGNIYAVSTFGAILSTFSFGFFLIPEISIFYLLIGVSGILFLIGIVNLVLNKKVFFLFLFIPYFFLLFPYSEKAASNSEFKILYKSEGVLGQLKVLDSPLLYKNNLYYRRTLLYNNIGQTIVNKINGSSFWDYPHYLSTLVGKYSTENNALVFGLGGGAVVKELNDLGFNVEVVELDKRMIDVTHEFFYPNLEAIYHVDDARHFLNTVKKKYNLIVFDVFLGENPPSHVFTVEVFKSLKKNLENNGIVCVNFNGYIDAEKGKATRAVINTVQQSGYNIKVISTRGEPLLRNTLIFASISDSTFNKTNKNRIQNSCCRNMNITTDLKFLNLKNLEINKAAILTDDFSYLDVLNYDVTYEWRKESIKLYQKDFIKFKIPFFK